MEKIKKYWIVRPSSYKDINVLLNAKYSSTQIDFFYSFYKDGMCITYNSEIKNEIAKWGHMP